jgi:predicted RNA-binding Zn ribbon-like protein
MASCESQSVSRRNSARSWRVRRRAKVPRFPGVARYAARPVRRKYSRYASPSCAVDWTASGLEHDRLVDYPRLLEWAGGAGMIDRSARARLLEIARGQPLAARSAYAHARWARWVVQRLFASVALGTPSSPALDDFNRLVRDAGRHLRLAYTGRDAGRVVWKPDRSDDLDIVLWGIARAATKLLESEASQLRICAGPDCGWLFVDRSRNGLRRWCEMQTCGTVVKSKRRAERHAARAG